MKRTITYRITGQMLKADRPVSASEFLRGKGYSRHLMTYLRHTDSTLLVNGKAVFTNRPLCAGDELTVIFEDTPGPDSDAHIIPSHMELNIIFEDEDILVIDKPPYLPVQPSLGHRERTLGNGVCAYYQEQGIPFVYRCVNRIDKNTSGLVLIARNMASSAILYDAMKTRQIHRTYFAVVHGKLNPGIFCCSGGGNPSRCADLFRGADASGSAGPAMWQDFPGVIDMPIARIPGSTIMRKVDPEKGKRAVTHYRILSYDEEKDITALLVKLETGRTHQIRVHMARIGHPIVGDGMYGVSPDMIGRQALHSLFLDLLHPVTGESLHFKAPLPEDIRSIISPENIN